jgi:DNA-binding transcriptional regulator YhcF (GntR family)
MNRPKALSLSQLREWLRVHQRRLAAGDKLPTISDIARRAGLHRDTIYALLNGDHVETRTQNGLSRVIREIEEETALYPKTKLLSIRMNHGMPRIQIGLDSKRIFA